MFDSRLKALQQLLITLKLDAVLVTAVPNIIYLTGYTGFSTEEREAFLLITPTEQFLLTDGRYMTAIKEQVGHFTLIEISSRYQFKKAFEQLVGKYSIKKLGIEENNLFVYEYKTILPFVKETMHVPVNQLRSKKSSVEIAEIEAACKIGDESIAAILPYIKPGVSERDVALRLENEMRSRGAEPSFRTIVAFDAHAAVPHHSTGYRRLGDRGVILIDSGVKVDNYCSDMTRTFFLGKVTDEQRKLYQTVYEAQAKAITYIKQQLENNKAVSAADADKAARDHIVKRGYPSFSHSLGHGIGLEVHESPTLSPVSKQILEEGMVFSIEPGIYLPGHSGVRIEDLFVIENNVLLQITQYPKHLIEL